MKRWTTRHVLLTGIVGIVTAGILGAAESPVAPSEPKKASGAILLDSFDANDWVVEGAPGTTFSITTRVPGKVNQALKLSYAFKEPKQWVQIHKEIAFDSMQGKAVQFYLKGTGKANTLEFKLVDGDGTNFGARLSGATNASDWHLVTLDETDFSYWYGGDAKLDGVRQIYIAAVAEQGGAGELFLDELQLVPSSRKTVRAGLLDACESAEGWVAEAAEKGTAQLYTVPGKKGKGLFLGYDVPAGQWAQLSKKFQITMTPTSALDFWIKGDGSDNDLEVKLVDADGTNFGKKLKGILKQKEWQEVRIPYKEMSYWYGGDATLDLDRIRAIYLAVSGRGGKGGITIDELTLTP